MFVGEEVKEPPKGEEAKKEQDMDDLFGEGSDEQDQAKIQFPKGTYTFYHAILESEVPQEVLSKHQEEATDINVKKRAAKGARKIKELNNLFS